MFTMFEFSKIDNFDNHINKSIPQYDFLVEYIRRISEYFIDRHTNVYDLGCSTGKLLKSMKKMNNVNYFGIDDSALIPTGHEYINFLKKDVFDVDYMNASFITSVFTLQFLPKVKRTELLCKIRNGLNQGGAFVICEKIYASDSMIQAMNTSLYYEDKSKNFTAEEIYQKELQLRENMKCQKFQELMNEVSIIGTPNIFWASYNFIGIIAVKETV